MALSFVQYPGDGQTRVFNVTFQYLKQENVKVRIDGDPVNFSWLDTARVELTTTPLPGQTVEIRRESDRTQRAVNFQDGSVLNEAALDADSDHLFEITQEAFDAADAAVALQSDGTMSAKGKRVSNVADPVNQQDAVTKEWAETANESVLKQGQDARDAAQVAQGHAETAQLAAEDARDLAAGHKADAMAAEDAAEAAKTAAQTAKTAAEQAELQAGNHETAAYGFAGDAYGFKGQAEAAQQAAEAAKAAAETAKGTAIQSKDTAVSKASEASGAATAAINAASAASTSETNASNSAFNASDSAGTATNKAAQAVTAANTAGTHASTATTAASQAAASEQAAGVSETNAAASALAAANSATSIGDAESNASASALAAQQAAAAAAASYDSFDDRYLGSFVSDPTTDNDGDPLVQGMMYFKTGKGMQVYDGSNWIAASASGTASMEFFDFTATQGQDTFTGVDDWGVSLSYMAGNIFVLLNGVTLRVDDYTATDGLTVVLTDPCDLDDEVVVVAFKSFTIANHYTKGEIDGKFALHSPNTHNHDGVYLKPNGDGSQLTGINTNPNDKAIGSTGFFDLPSGTTAQRPSNPAEGYIRLNTTENKLEAFQGGEWRTYSPDQPLTITGGTVSQSGGYTYHTFTSSGNFTIAGGSGSVQLEYMIVAGGGGGGIGYETANAGDGAGGGGAGGMIVENAAVPNGSYTITIGAGGSHQNQGGNTLALGKTAIGGGKGGTDINGNSGNQAHGGSGGSGGGAASDWDGGGRSGGAGTAGQGHNGGSTNGASGWRIGAGGGGRGGGGSSDEGRGVGGVGYTWVNGTTYAGGGGGGTSSNGGEVGNNGGAGGGGRGGSYGGGFGGQAGAANTGGGGGGDSSGGYTQYGGSGGSGIVIIRYPTLP